MKPGYKQTEVGVTYSTVNHWDLVIVDEAHKMSAYSEDKTTLPHPERKQPEMSQMISDPAIEIAAVDAVIAHEEARGWKVQSVESENRGFDLISRKPHPEDPSTAIEVRFIEVKGRAAIGEVALTTNEYKTADRLKKDFWLYVVFNCATQVFPLIFSMTVSK